MSTEAEEFDFYPCLVDRQPASIYLDLRFERSRPEGTDTRYWVTITMLERGPHGVGTADEGDAINTLEEAVIARARELDVVYAGRLRTRGTWEITLYGPVGHAEALRAAAAPLAGGRRLDVTSALDRDWSYYRELLLPDAERRQWMDDRRMVQIFTEQGDRLTTPRRVDHRATFATADARDRFLTAIATQGFTAIERADEDGTLDAQVFRTDPIDLDHIHDVVMLVVDAATAQGGTYDRWEASIES